jgi:hypothetical protein
MVLDFSLNPTANPAIKPLILLDKLKNIRGIATGARDGARRAIGSVVGHALTRSQGWKLESRFSQRISTSHA